MAAGPGTRLHVIWKGIKKRCQTPTDGKFADYGARGITLCEEWQTFTGFLDWALVSGYAADLAVDRIDVDGPYEPANCRWVTTLVNNARRDLDRRGAYLLNLTGKLTAQIVAEVEARSKAYKLSDQHGLFLHVAVSGVKSWRYAFRFAEKERLLTLGRFPAMSLDEARELQLVARKRLKEGRNPALIKRETKARRAREAHKRGIKRVRPAAKADSTEGK